MEIIAVSRDLAPHTRDFYTRRQHTFRIALIYHQTHFRRLSIDNIKRNGDISHRAPNDVNVVGVRKKLKSFLLSNSGKAMAF